MHKHSSALDTPAYSLTSSADVTFLWVAFARLAGLEKGRQSPETTATSGVAQTMEEAFAFGPTEISKENDQDLFSDNLRNLIQDVPPHDITIVLSDFNATISAEACDPRQPIPGPIFIDSFTNDNGNRLLNLCRFNNLCISDTWFPRKQIHHWTWYSPDGTTQKPNDHILISQRWRFITTNCRVYRGAEMGNTDHRLLIADMRLKLKANPTNKSQPRLNSAKLADPVMKTSYQCSISNRFNALANDNSDNWQHFKQEVCKAAEETIGRTRPSPEQPWISMETLKNH
ncbi:craniofacial development protein 2-like [Penaeus japonicus]|uniref:craniofacial development protein 2-like n=1 Tax=Penaeus japonicus TaxID=27405 RepID=UPI001C717B2C|nr:craniofacial development protein 2-like [Penaeus japonicus]